MDARSLGGWLVDAFDPDIQIFQRQLLDVALASDEGSRFADWANANPAPLRLLLGVSSAVLRRHVRGSGPIQELLARQLQQLPADLLGGILDADSKNRSRSRDLPDDELFLDRYRDAVAEALDTGYIEDPGLITQMDHGTLVEWVKSPSRIRPFIIQKWMNPPGRKRVNIKLQEAFETPAKHYLNAGQDLIMQTRYAEGFDFWDLAIELDPEMEMLASGRAGEVLHRWEPDPSSIERADSLIDFFTPELFTRLEKILPLWVPIFRGHLLGLRTYRGLLAARSDVATEFEVFRRDLAAVRQMWSRGEISKSEAVRWALCLREHYPLHPEMRHSIEVFLEEVNPRGKP